jgi:hypothetical protein
MAITQTVCSSFKSELLAGVHNFTPTTGDVFKIALYTSEATLNDNTVVYTTDNECPATGGYSAGGNVLVSKGVDPSGTTVYIDFDDSSWLNSTITASGALVYNSSKANKAVCVFNFGGTYNTNTKDFTVTFPPSSATTAVLIVN